MAHKSILYLVVVYKMVGFERDEEVIYETTKREKAEKFLREYLKRYGDQIDGAYIESKLLQKYDKRSLREDIDL